MNVRFPWTTVNRNMHSPPDDVVEQGYYRRAGFRCRELLYVAAPDIPVIIHSGLDADELADEVEKLPANAKYLMTYDGGLRRMVNSLLR